ncbi:MAG: hypothetical protein KDI44_08325 [Thiothrix sp.]|nr:hypothetical protein [Thiothrix sp.]HPQ94415.1 hypothetical protein [Thiolinea sp.]
MSFFLGLFSLLMIVVGAMFIYKPDFMAGNVKLYADEPGFHVLAAVGRILLGLAFMVYAAQAHLSGLVGFLGLVMFLAGVFLLVISHDRFSAIVNRMVDHYGQYARHAGIFVAVVGAILFYAVAL